MDNKLQAVVIASSEGTRAALYNQLRGLPYLAFDGILLELSDAARICAEKQPDILIIELTGRELDGGLFIQTLKYDPTYPIAILALHQEFSHQVIEETVQKGADEFIQFPEQTDKLREVLDAFYQDRQQPSPDQDSDSAAASESGQKSIQPGRIITVFSSKGGNGATTLAVNLAHELYQSTEQPVVLFDLDQMFNNVPIMLNMKPSYSLGDIAGMKPDEVDNLVLRKLVLKHDSGMDVVVSCKNILDDNEMLSPALLEKQLNYLKQNYRYVIIDLPTHVLDPYHQYIVEASDQLLLLSSMDLPSLNRTKQYLDLAKIYLAESKVKLVLNRCTLASAFGMSNDELEDVFDYPVFSRLPNDWELTLQAHSMGQPLSAINMKAPLVKAVQRLALLLTGRTDTAPEIKTSGQGIFEKLIRPFMKQREAKHVIR